VNSLFINIQWTCRSADWIASITPSDGVINPPLSLSFEKQPLAIHVCGKHTSNWGCQFFGFSQWHPLGILLNASMNITEPWQICLWHYCCSSLLENAVLSFLQETAEEFYPIIICTSVTVTLTSVFFVRNRPLVHLKSISAAAVSAIIWIWTVIMRPDSLSSLLLLQHLLHSVRPTTRSITWVLQLLLYERLCLQITSPGCDCIFRNSFCIQTNTAVAETYTGKSWTLWYDITWCHSETFVVLHLHHNSCLFLLYCASCKDCSVKSYWKTNRVNSQWSEAEL